MQIYHSTVCIMLLVCLYLYMYIVPRSATKKAKFFVLSYVQDGAIAQFNIPVRVLAINFSALSAVYCRLY